MNGSMPPYGRSGSMRSRTRSCPDLTELKAFAIGNLPEPLISHLANHVLSCATCEARLRSFDNCSDGLLDGLRNLSNAQPDAGFELPHELMSVARGVVASPAQDSPSDVAIDVGRRFANQLAAGI